MDRIEAFLEELVRRGFLRRVGYDEEGYTVYLLTEKAEEHARLGLAVGEEN